MSIKTLRTWLESDGQNHGPFEEMVEKALQEHDTIVLNSVSRKEVIERITRHLESMDSALHGERPISAFEYQCKATSLVELIEVHDCGSVGGFDKGQPRMGGGPVTQLLARFNWIKKKVLK